MQDGHSHPTSEHTAGMLDWDQPKITCVTLPINTFVILAGSRKLQGCRPAHGTSQWFRHAAHISRVSSCKLFLWLHIEFLADTP